MNILVHLLPEKSDFRGYSTFNFCMQGYLLIDSGITELISRIYCYKYEAYIFATNLKRI